LRGQGVAPAPAALTRARHRACPSDGCSRLWLLCIQYIALCSCRARVDNGAASATALTPPPRRPRAPASDARRAPSSSSRFFPCGWLRGARMPLSGSAARARRPSHSREIALVPRHGARRARPWRLPRGAHAPHHAGMQCSTRHGCRHRRRLQEAALKALTHLHLLSALCGLRAQLQRIGCGSAESTVLTDFD
jgi:hypothetical protein